MIILYWFLKQGLPVPSGDLETLCRLCWPQHQRDPPVSSSPPPNIPSASVKGFCHHDWLYDFFLWENIPPLLFFWTASHSPSTLTLPNYTILLLHGHLLFSQNHMDVETFISKDSKLASTYEREHWDFVYFCFGYLTQDICFQFHLTMSFIFSFFLKSSKILYQ